MADRLVEARYSDGVGFYCPECNAIVPLEGQDFYKVAFVFNCPCGAGLWYGVENPRLDERGCPTGDCSWWHEAVAKHEEIQFLKGEPTDGQGP